MKAKVEWVLFYVNYMWANKQLMLEITELMRLGGECDDKGKRVKGQVSVLWKSISLTL